MDHEEQSDCHIIIHAQCFKLFLLCSVIFMLMIKLQDLVLQISQVCDIHAQIIFGRAEINNGINCFLLLSIGKTVSCAG